MHCPLTGKPCDKLKNVKFSDIQNGVKNEYSLCEECASAHLQNTVEQVMLPACDILKELIDLTGSTEHVHTHKQNPCPNCGITEREVSKLGRFGCPHCYTHFGAKLENALQSMHNAVQHTGKVPKRWARERNKRISVEQYLANLEKQMAIAVKSENYEAAAVFRDSIKLTKTLNDEELGLKKELAAAVEAEDFEKAAALKKQIQETIEKALTSRSDTPDPEIKPELN